MKKTLLLGAVALMASTAMAQVSEPTLTQDWLCDDASILPAKADARWGAGYNGNVYVQVRGKGVECFSYNGTETVKSTVEGLVAAGQGVAFDGAGNILISDGWAGAGAMTKFVLYNASTGETTKLDISANTTFAAEAGRMDYMGRGVGNIFSTEGGALFMSGQGKTSVVKLFIANGEFDEAKSKIITNVYTSAVDNMAIVVPLTEDPNSDDIAVRSRSNEDFYYNNGSEWVKYTRPTGSLIDKCTTAGGDVVTLGGALLTIEPTDATGPEDNYKSSWQIVERATNTLVKSVAALGTSTGYSATALSVQKISDTKAYIYQYHPGQFVARYSFEVPANYFDALTAIEVIEAENAPVEYYNLQGVKVANPEKGLFIKKQGNKATKVVL